MKLFLEGPGAGYTIHSKGIEYISGENIKVESISKDNIVLTGKFRFTIDSITADSYDYGTEKLDDIPAVANKLDLDIKYENISAYDDFEDSLKPSAVQKIKEYLYDCYSDDYDSVNDVELSDLYGNYGCNDSLMYDILTVDDFNTDSKPFKFFIEELIEETMEDYADFNYGGGYSHVTYNGQVMSIDDLDSANMFIDDSDDYGKKVVDYIDKVVSGETTYTEYRVFTQDMCNYIGDKEEATARFINYINTMIEDGTLESEIDDDLSSFNYYNNVEEVTGYIDFNGEEHTETFDIVMTVEDVVDIRDYVDSEY